MPDLLHYLSASRFEAARSVALFPDDHPAEALPQMDRIDLYERQGCGAFLSWGPEAPALPV